MFQHVRRGRSSALPRLFNSFRSARFVHSSAIAVSLCLLSAFVCPPARADLVLNGKLNINSATREELLLLPFIGDVRSLAIYSHRERKGPFETIDSLRLVEGIGEKTLQKIRPFVKLDGKSDLFITDDQAADGTGRAAPSANQSCADASSGRILADGAYFDALIGAIEGARREIAVSFFLFKTTDYPANRANRIMAALADASKRSVRVSVLLERGEKAGEGVTADNRATAEKLEKHGIEVLFDDPKRTTHTKAVVIDGKTLFLGSHNLTHSALGGNNELSIVVESPGMAKEVLAYMRNLR